MRKLFSEYSLTMLAAVTSIIIFNIFSSVMYYGDNTPLEQIIRSWVGRLT